MSFLRAFSGEMRKLVRPRGLIVLAVIFAVFFIMYAVVYNVNMDAIYQSLGELLGEDGIIDLGNAVYDSENDRWLYVAYDDEGNAEYITADEYAERFGYMNLDYFALANEENIDEIISEIEAYNDTLKRSLNDPELTPEHRETIYDESVLLGNSARVLRYMKEHGIYGAHVEGYSGDLESLFGMGMKSAEGFTYNFFEFAIGILMLYGIVIAAGSYADEYSRGTIKLVMLRPISRNALTAAKLLSLFAYLAAIGYLSTFVAYIYGLIAYGSVSTETVLVAFNNSSVFATTYGGNVFLKMFLNTVMMFSTVILSFTISTLLKKKTGGIVLSLVVLSGIVAGLIGALGGGVERFLFSTNTDLTTYFGLTSVNPEGYNFFIALPVLLVYLAGLLAAVFITVNKRDVI